MSDFLTQEDLDRIKARDARFKVIELGIEIEGALRGSSPLALLLSRLHSDAEKAVEEFAHANCGNLQLMQDLQSRVFRYRYAKETFERIMTEGLFAQQSVESEDEVSSEWN